MISTGTATDNRFQSREESVVLAVDRYFFLQQQGHQGLDIRGVGFQLPVVDVVQEDFTAVEMYLGHLAVLEVGDEFVVGDLRAALLQMPENKPGAAQQGDQEKDIKHPNKGYHQIPRAEDDPSRRYFRRQTAVLSQSHKSSEGSVILNWLESNKALPVPEKLSKPFFRGTRLARDMTEVELVDGPLRPPAGSRKISANPPGVERDPQRSTTP